MTGAFFIMLCKWIMYSRVGVGPGMPRLGDDHFILRTCWFEVVGKRAEKTTILFVDAQRVPFFQQLGFQRVLDFIVQAHAVRYNIPWLALSKITSSGKQEYKAKADHSCVDYNTI